MAAALLPFGSAPYNQSKDTIHVLKAGDTMTGPLNIQGSGTIQTWLTSGGDPLAHVDTSLGTGTLVVPYNPATGNLYLGQTQIGNGGINYTYDSSISSPYTNHDFLQVWNGYNASVVARIDATGAAVFASISAPAYVTGDNGYVEVAMGFFGGTPGLYIHDTNGTPTDYMQFVKNNGTYIVQTTWDGQTTFGAYALTAVALIARGYSTSTADLQQWQQWGGTGGASGTVVSKIDYLGNLYVPGFQLSTSPTSGYILTSDSSGNGTWQAPAYNGPTSSSSVSLTAGTAYQNTSGKTQIISGVINITAAVGGSINLGMGATSTPTTQAISPALSTALLLPFTARVPNNYYLLIQTSGTITVGSITAVST